MSNLADIRKKTVEIRDWHQLMEVGEFDSSYLQIGKREG